jgi:anti-anti-sigma factor
MTSVLDADHSFMGSSARSILRAVPQRSSQGAVITLDGEIDISSAAQIRAAVFECLRRPPPETLVIDMSAVTFCDCSGIEALEWAQSRAETGHAHFTLSGVDPRLRRIFTLAQARELLDACHSARSGNAGATATSDN